MCVLNVFVRVWGVRLVRRGNDDPQTVKMRARLTSALMDCWVYEWMDGWMDGVDCLMMRYDIQKKNKKANKETNLQTEQETNNAGKTTDRLF